MSYRVKNAVILAAGCSKRFAPLSQEIHKGLIEVRGEILIERQIRQLMEAGIHDIYIVVGYKADSFEYLIDKFNVKLINNHEYTIKNNISSIYAAKEYISDSYICSSDNYFMNNPFCTIENESFYAAEYAKEDTDEWCITYDSNGVITDVTVGGSQSWYMLGHTFWSRDFSERFLKLLEEEYRLPEIGNMLWESFYIRHINELKMKIKKYPRNAIFEFDSLDELRCFDTTYLNDTRSSIIKKIASERHCKECEINGIIPVISDERVIGFEYTFHSARHTCLYD